MPAAAKWILILMLNAVLSGSFALGVSAVHFFWLEYATRHWPRVHYTENYEATFTGICAAAFFVLLTTRQAHTRLDRKFLRLGEVGFLLIFIAIIMVVLTPVPGTNFASYLYERTHAGKSSPSTSAVPAPALGGFKPRQFAP